MNENFVWNKETHTYEIVKESLVEVAKRNIDAIAEKANIVIQNDEDFKAVKKLRTELNNSVKEVADARKQMTAVVLSRFAPMCLEIEKYGAFIAQQLTDKINEYKPVQRDVTFKITIKSKDKKAIEKVKAYAIKFDCEVKEE